MLLTRRQPYPFWDGISAENCFSEHFSNHIYFLCEQNSHQKVFKHHKWDHIFSHISLILIVIWLSCQSLSQVTHCNLICWYVDNINMILFFSFNNCSRAAIYHIWIHFTALIWRVFFSSIYFVYVINMWLFTKNLLLMQFDEFFV